jgi:hypothetical protein
MNTSRNIKYSLLLIGFAALISCRPQPEDAELVQNMVASTNYDTTARFRSFATYALPTDTIGFVSNNSNDTIITAGQSDLPRPLLSAVESDMNAYGYTRVTRNQNPDLAVNVYIVNNFNVFQSVYYPGYYSPYSSYYYPSYYGYGSYYSYYPYVSTYTSNTAALVIELVDMKNRSGNQVKVIWTAYIADLIATVNRVNKSVEAIHRAFSQSPYLDKQ